MTAAGREESLTPASGGVGFRKISRPASQLGVNHELLAVNFDHRRGRITGHDVAFACHNARCDPANERDPLRRLWQR